ncbi:MAG TPA: hypothetical protein VIV60_15795 [Polyangiaceae bacterium]
MYWQYLLAAAVICGCAPARAQPAIAPCVPVTAPERARPITVFGDQTPSPSSPPAANAARSSAASDPVVTDGDKYHAILENDHVRVLVYRDKPGDKTHPHHHSEFVLYALSPFRRRLVFPDGSIRERDFKTGDVIWMPAQDHIGENTGTTDTDVVIVEFKAR